ncbi:unnamed protein product [Prorocentrum cordatum]|uniref:Calpain catalytic domain-containing protein n=1 Tax=Prorocentrum cordatum TaxID=2364126 RepID=A0ABN9TBR4_9DINO|nr:unnamed protein product [Polarella glacialis]
MWEVVASTLGLEADASGRAVEGAGLAKLRARAMLLSLENIGGRQAAWPMAVQQAAWRDRAKAQGRMVRPLALGDRVASRVKGAPRSMLAERAADLESLSARLVGRESVEQKRLEPRWIIESSSSFAAAPKAPPAAGALLAMVPSLEAFSGVFQEVFGAAESGAGALGEVAPEDIGCPACRGQRGGRARGEPCRLGPLLRDGGGGVLIAAAAMHIRARRAEGVAWVMLAAALADEAGGQGLASAGFREEREGWGRAPLEGVGSLRGKGACWPVGARERCGLRAPVIVPMSTAFAKKPPGEARGFYAASVDIGSSRAPFALAATSAWRVGALGVEARRAQIAICELQASPRARAEKQGRELLKMTVELDGCRCQLQRSSADPAVWAARDQETDQTLGLLLARVGDFILVGPKGLVEDLNAAASEALMIGERALRYWAGSRGFGLLCAAGSAGDTEETDEIVLEVYTDASMGEAGAQSVAAPATFGQVVDCRSTRQAVGPFSTAKAEVEENAVGETMLAATRATLESLGSLVSPEMLVDSAAANLAPSGQGLWTARPLTTKARAVRSRAQRGFLMITQVGTADQRADGLTKSGGPKAVAISSAPVRAAQRAAPAEQQRARRARGAGRRVRARAMGGSLAPACAAEHPLARCAPEWASGDAPDGVCGRGRRRAGGKFVDPNFRLEATTWIRLPDLLEMNGCLEAGDLEGTPRLVWDDCIEPGDLTQGGLGNCWLVFPHAVRELFVEVDVARGRYVVRLYDMDRAAWENVEVDDFIPCTREEDWSRLKVTSGADGGRRYRHEDVYDQRGRKKVPGKWAVAKFVGCYAHLAGGSEPYALSAFTGFPLVYCFARPPAGADEAKAALGRWDRHGSQHFGRGVTGHALAEVDGAEAPLNDREMWAKVIKYEAQNYLMTSSITKFQQPESTRGFFRPDGLVLGHAYSLISGKTAVKSNGDVVSLVLLRNPHGDVTESEDGVFDSHWRGAWCNGSANWVKHPEVAVQASGIFTPPIRPNLPSVLLRHAGPTDV